MEKRHSLKESRNSFAGPRKVPVGPAKPREEQANLY